jgi:hypothetical protein
VLRTVPSSLGLNRLIASVAAIVLASAGIARAQVVLVPPTPQVGSSNPATAEPPVPRPHTKPCIVPLFQELAFADFNLKSFSYTPPSACPGPWAKVVFTADFTVTEGRQFDRTAAFYLGHANIYYGTTAEPRATLSPSWHVERDLTDLSAVFKSPQTGEANIGNFVGVSGGVTFNGIIYANAALEFYPADREDGAPRVPDVVVPVNGGGGDAGTLNTTTDRITQTLNLPTNVERVVLDVIAQSQINDEFWYLCVPNDQTSNLQSCGNTSFRETEVFIDGQLAGVAPVYPWIYTGGIDPFLWEPIVGVQTLNFKPYRVDLTPFAGLLSDGNTHTVSVGVFNANSFFLATANLLAFTDHNKQQVIGGIISNTLSAAPTPVVTEKISTNPGGTFTGSVAVASNRKFAIRGYVNTSHGRVETTVDQTVDFLSNQQFNVGPTTDIQNAQQTSTVDSRTTTREAFFVNTTEQHFSYPLTVDFSFLVKSDGSFTQATTIAQKDIISESKSLNGFKFFDSNLSNEVNSTDTLGFNSSGALLGPTGSQATQTYSAKDSFGHCFSRTITAAGQVLTSVSDGEGCKRDGGDSDNKDR